MSCHVNDLFNFEAIDRLFLQISNFFFQKQTKMLFFSEYCLMCYNKCLIFISKEEKKKKKRTCQHVRHIDNTILMHKDPFLSVMFHLSINSSKLSTEVLHTKFDLPYFVKEMFN